MYMLGIVYLLSIVIGIIVLTLIVNYPWIGVLILVAASMVMAHDRFISKK